MMKIVLYTSLLILIGCQPLHILPGLCYTDKTGTYLCENNTPAPIVNNPKGQRATSQNTLVCYEEQENGVFIDTCRGLELYELNRIYEEQ